MLKSLIAGLAVALLLGGASLAQTCTSYPNTLTNGTTADATQVMANFQCAALTGNGLFTGNVGIGVTSPSFALTVVASSYGQAYFGSTGSQAGGINIDNASGGNQSFILFKDGGANKWQIGKQADNSYFDYDVTNATNFVTVNTAGLLQLGEGAQIQIPKSGYVGIGTSSPSAPLTIVSPLNTSAAYLTVLPQNLTQSVNISYNHIFEGGSNGNNSLLIDAQSTGNVILQANGGTGNVGIGTSTPANLLDIAGQAAFGSNVERLTATSGIMGWNRNATTGQIYNTSIYAYQMQHFGSSTNTSDYWTMQVYSPSDSIVTGPGLTINGAGEVAVGTVQSTYQFYVNGSAAGATAWTNASDARLKTKVAEIGDALSLIGRLRGVRFQWRPPEDREVGKSLALPVGEPQIGFIAQEVAAVVPEAVVAPRKGSGEPYGVKDASLVPILVEAVKEQQAEIEALRAELEALKQHP